MTVPQMMAEALPADGVNWTPNALVIPDGLGFEAWEQVGGTLSIMERGHQWWIGDWLNYGERQYGEKYAQGVQETGRRRQTLANLAWVAGRIEVSRRRDNLSWSHHEAVTALEREDQDRLLDDAERKQWSRQELREAVQALKKAVPPAPSESTRAGRSEPDPADDGEPAAERPPLQVALEPEDDDEMDLASELERADDEIRSLQLLVDSLQATDAGKEVAAWALKYNQLEGRLRHEMQRANEATRQATRQGKVLRELRKVFGVERDTDLLEAVRQRQVA
jgi:hypothetical protein